METDRLSIMEDSMISTELEYSYDPVKDIHFFNTMHADRPTRGRSRDKSTIVV